MKYYRVIRQLDGRYAVQRKYWLIWLVVRDYSNSSEAFMHLDGLNRGASYEHEMARNRRFDRINEFIQEIRDQWRT